MVLWCRADVDLKELYGGASRRHPWETARVRHFLRLLERNGALATSRRVLDVGAGDGFFARALVERLGAGAGVVCFDAHYADEHLRQLAANGDGRRVTFARTEPEDEFDLVLLLDVVEHVPDDHAFLSGIVRRRLGAGGMALVSVPAWETLYTRHDVALGHFRRYRPEQLQGLVEAAGLEVIDVGNLFHSLLPVRALQKLGELVSGHRSRPEGPGFGQTHEDLGVGAWRVGALVTGAIDRCLDLDNVLGGRLGFGSWRLPGLSTWALARKR
jgi:SAM-dependent methyltransferase